MPKRTFWLVTGAAVGAGSSLWVERRVRRTVQQATARLQPDALVVEVGRSARQAAGSAGDRLRNAVASGRDEMQRREEELWAELAAQGVTVDPGEVAPVPPAAPTPFDERREPSRPDRLPQRAAGIGRARRTPAKSPSHLAR